MLVSMSLFLWVWLHFLQKDFSYITRQLLPLYGSPLVTAKYNKLYSLFFLCDLIKMAWLKFLTLGGELGDRFVVGNKIIHLSPPQSPVAV